MELSGGLASATWCWLLLSQLWLAERECHHLTLIRSDPSFLDRDEEVAGVVQSTFSALEVVGVVGETLLVLVVVGVQPTFPALEVVVGVVD